MSRRAVAVPVGALALGIGAAVGVVVSQMALTDDGRRSAQRGLCTLAGHPLRDWEPPDGEYPRHRYCWCGKKGSPDAILIYGIPAYTEHICGGHPPDDPFGPMCWREKGHTEPLHASGTRTWTDPTPEPDPPVAREAAEPSPHRRWFQR